MTRWILAVGGSHVHFGGYLDGLTVLFFSRRIIFSKNRKIRAGLLPSGWTLSEGWSSKRGGSMPGLIVLFFLAHH